VQRLADVSANSALQVVQVDKDFVASAVYAHELHDGEHAENITHTIMSVISSHSQ